ncbi:MAG: metallopeptidase TldD-related protein [Acidobacteriota bacterium]
MNIARLNRKNMRLFPWMIMALLTLSIPSLLMGGFTDEALFKAMDDELQRTIRKLKMENLDKPYYVEYAVTEFQNFELDGSFGTITRKIDDRNRYLLVDLRVGDYTFDNTNFIGDWSGILQRAAELTIENDYDALRQDIWLASDQAYKAALEKLARKRAYVQTKAITDLPDDLSREEPYTVMESRVDLKIDRAAWEKAVMELSGIFREYPSINDSNVTFKAIAINRYFLNSEGFKNRRGTSVILVGASASTQAADGQNIFNYETFYARDINDLPAREDIAKKIREFARITLDISHVEQLSDYSGPVLFTGQASGEFFRQLLAANVSSPQTPLLADERYAGMVQKGKLAGKLNLRILPSFIDVIDDPTLRNWNGVPLIGWYGVDDDGVPPQRVSLIESGKLVNLLMSRIPTKKLKQSNGHSRGSLHIPAEGRPANMIITAKEKTSLKDLKAKLLEYCREMGLEYGIVVTKLRDKNSYLESDSSTDLTPEQRKTELSFPVEAYKVYVEDGREELIRGAEFEGITVRALKDILEAGDDSFAYNILLGNNPELPASLVTPSVLVEELDLKKSEIKPSKPPILKSPLMN